MYKLVALILAVVWAGVSVAQFNGCPPGFCNQSASSAPPSTNNLLLVDGVSKLLLVDGASKLCLASGC